MAVTIKGSSEDIGAFADQQAGVSMRACADEKDFPAGAAGARAGKKPYKRKRPKKYDRTIADAVFTALAKGKTLAQVCASNPAFPCPSTIANWVAEDADLKARYETAYGFHLAALEDQIIDLPDAIQVGDYTGTLPDGTKVKIKTSDKIGKVKLQMAGRLARLRARQNAYGKVGAGDGDGVFRVINSPDLDDPANA
ncbi:hypothetical protein [Caballeronia sp. LjRoot31]|uniref:terminase small subunit-like protein n=1 Tax=Caballeronia sp. LjRoot31 TaxID=3342324 RepID=UPI003ED0F79B